MQRANIIALNLARKDCQAIASICRKALGWWNVAEFSAFAKEPLVELNAIRARRGDFVKPEVAA